MPEIITKEITSKLDIVKKKIELIQQQRAVLMLAETEEDYRANMKKLSDLNKEYQELHKIVLDI